jgi:SAM-dependent methyltransferase
MSDSSYIHGHGAEEQRRLIAQAEYWRDSLIVPDLSFAAGQRLLDVGCGVGAVLGVIASAFPGLELCGIDRAEAQIAAAREHLASLGVACDLRVGDASRLPWPDGAFDHVYMMWFLEHVEDPRPFLAEARRVLAPGGTITINETDYSMLHVWPPSVDVEYLAAGQRALFQGAGNPMVGRALGALLGSTGFDHVRSAPIGFHHFTGAGQPGLRALVDYLLGFLEPMVPRMVAVGFDAERLRSAVDVFRRYPDRAEASVTQIVFRATARRS